MTALKFEGVTCSENNKELTLSFSRPLSKKEQLSLDKWLGKWSPDEASQQGDESPDG